MVATISTRVSVFSIVAIRTIMRRLTEAGARCVPAGWREDRQFKIGDRTVAELSTIGEPKYEEPVLLVFWDSLSPSERVRVRDWLPEAYRQKI